MTGWKPDNGTRSSLQVFGQDAGGKRAEYLDKPPGSISQFSNGSTVVNWVLCGSVKLVLGAIGKLRQSRRHGSRDIEGCARVLWWLWVAGKRQSFAEIVAALPGLNPVRVFEDLRTINGVLFLTVEPAGLTLDPELKTELHALMTNSASVAR